MAVVGLHLVDHEAPVERHDAAAAVATVGAVRAFVLCREIHRLARVRLAVLGNESGEELGGNGREAVLAGRAHHGEDMAQKIGRAVDLRHAGDPEVDVGAPSVHGSSHLRLVVPSENPEDL